MEWIDLAWVPIVALVTKGALRIKAVLFVLCCSFMLRLQVRLMSEIGFKEGFLNWIDMPLLQRGMIVYGVFIAIFLLLVGLSKENNAYVFIAASITIFTIAFCISTVAMVL